MTITRSSLSSYQPQVCKSGSDTKPDKTEQSLLAPAPTPASVLDTTGAELNKLSQIDPGLSRKLEDQGRSSAKDNGLDTSDSVKSAVRPHAPNQGLIPYQSRAPHATHQDLAPSKSGDLTSKANAWAASFKNQHLPIMNLDIADLLSADK